MHVDARALCQAAVSLESFTLEVAGSCTAESLAGIFDHKPLKELDLTVYSTCTVEVSTHTCYYRRIVCCGLRSMACLQKHTAWLPPNVAIINSVHLSCLISHSGVKRVSQFQMHIIVSLVLTFVFVCARPTYNT